MSHKMVRLVAFVMILALVLPVTALAAPEGSGPLTHTVKTGETLSQIAATYGLTVAAIAAANNIRNVDIVWVGQQLCIPVGGSNSACSQPVPTVSTPAPGFQPLAAPPEYKPPAPAYQPQSANVAQPPVNWAPPVSAGQPAAAPSPLFVMVPGNEQPVIHAETKWVGSQTNDTPDPNGITSLIVLVDSQEGLNVAVQSDSGFTGSGVTGQYYEFSWVRNFAFRGIPAGFYHIWIEGAPSKVTTAQVFPYRRTWVEFKWTGGTPDVLQASSTGWVADILENTNGDKPLGVASILIVKSTAADQLVRVTAPGGYEGTCITGTKPEHGPNACDIGGLSAGTYTVTVDGIGISLELYLDGRGSATVAFHPE